MEKKKILKSTFIFLISLLFANCSTYKPFKPPSEWETYKMSEAEIVEYLQTNYQTNHFIEGIWRVSIDFTYHSIPLDRRGSGYNPNMCDVAIIRENRFNQNERKYLIVMISAGSTDWNFPGRIKGRLTRINENSYSVDWYSQRYNLVHTKFYFNSYGELFGNFQYTENKIIKIEDFTFSKVYPQKETFQNDNKEVEENVLSFGSGILISSDGIVITNYHIVKNASEIVIEIPTKNILKYAFAILTDVNNDIAILKLFDFQYDSIYSQNIPFSFADVSKIKLGQSVFTLGYPLGEILGNTPRVSTGVVNSLFGISDDPRLLQISNPLQPGNSGSPLFNKEGEIIGLVVASLDAKYFYDNLGIIPQNVNFAIKNNFIKNLLESLPNSNALNNKNLLNGLSLETQIEKIQPFILKINASRKAN